MNNSENVIEDPPSKIKTEVAVIGSGPGGSVTASILSEELSDVLLIEAGEYSCSNPAPSYDQKEMKQKYRNSGMTFTINSPTVTYVEGKCIGGASEINSGLYGEISDRILNSWKKKYQIKDLTLDGLENYYETIKEKLNVQKIPFSIPRSSRVLADGSDALDWSWYEAPRWYRYDENGDETPDQQTMSKTYIPEALGHGARLLPRTEISKIRKSGDEFILENKNPVNPDLRIQAKNVFVCCGTTQTPKLLHQSGMGQNVGRNLKLHPFVKATAIFDEKVVDERMKVGVHKVDEFSPVFRLGCSISSPSHIATNIVNFPEKFRSLQEEPGKYGLYYARTRGGKGRLRFVPGLEDPLVYYSFTEEELEKLAEGLRRLGECLLAGGAREILPNLHHGVSITNQGDLEKLPGKISPKDNLTSVHLFSSCPMGENSSRCTVNSFGRLHGQSNVYVSDASILPDSPGTNPQATIMALAYRNARKFLENL